MICYKLSLAAVSWDFQTAAEVLNAAIRSQCWACSQWCHLGCGKSPSLHCQRRSCLAIAWDRYGHECSRGRQCSLGEADINLQDLKVHWELNSPVKDYIHLPFESRLLLSLTAPSSRVEAHTPRMAGQHPAVPQLLPASLGAYRCCIRQRKAPLLFPTWNCSENLFRIVSTKLEHKRYRNQTKLVSEATSIACSYKMPCEPHLIYCRIYFAISAN